jgi:hypothetical protein
MPTDKEIRSNIIALLRSGIGFGVELFAILSIDQLEDRRFRILHQPDWNKSVGDSDAIEYIYDDVKRAVDHFLEIRDKFKIGFDHEKVTPLVELMDHIEREVSITPDKHDEKLVNIHGKIPLAVLEKCREEVEARKGKSEG